MAFVQALVDDIRQKRVYRRFNEKADRKRRIVSQLLVIGANLAGIYYISWLIIFLNWQAPVMAILFLAAEITALISADIGAAINWQRRFHDPGLVSSLLTNAYSVDIFITVSQESFSVAHKTIEAAINIDYPKKKIYVLDDGDSIVLRLFAENAGCVYLSRPVKENYKAGNLNYGLSRSNGELVMTLDADQICQSDILKKTVGLFNITTIAYVQTAQDFDVSHGDPYGNKEEVFYRAMQLSKDADNSAFSCGSAVIYRRKALESLGGFSTWNLVEDLHTSLRLHSNGWRSVYYDHPLSKGTAPEEIWSYYRQRWQWCTDSLRLLFWDNPFLKKGLRPKQKLQYFHTGFSYLISAFVMPLFYLIPIWSFFTGKFLVTAAIYQYAVIRLIFLVLQHSAHRVSSRPGNVHKPYQMWNGLFPVYMFGAIFALFSRRRKPVYRVTPKLHAKRSNYVFAVLPQLLIIIATVAAFFYAYINKTGSAELRIVTSFWAIWNIWTLFRVPFVAIFHKPRPLGHISMRA